MSERRYFRGPAEPPSGLRANCIAYLEFVDDLNTRSVWACGDRYFSSREGRIQHAEEILGARILSDQPLSKANMSIPEVEEISQAEFEEIWARSGTL